MKKVISLALCVMLLLCGCGEEQTIPTTTATVPTTAPTEPGCVHAYRDADCENPKTCTLCGATRGSALGHDYMEGICTRCGEADASYLPLVGTAWAAISVSENGCQLEQVGLTFTEEGCTISGILFNRLSDVPTEERTDAMLNEENWYDYGGEVYYRSGAISAQALTCQVEGNSITCTLIRNDVAVGTLLLERTAGNMLSVTYFEGEFTVQFLIVGDVFGGNYA